MQSENSALWLSFCIMQLWFYTKYLYSSVWKLIKSKWKLYNFVFVIPDKYPWSKVTASY